MLQLGWRSNKFVLENGGKCRDHGEYQNMDTGLNNYAALSLSQSTMENMQHMENWSTSNVGWRSAKFVLENSGKCRAHGEQENMDTGLILS